MRPSYTSFFCIILVDTAISVLVLLVALQMNQESDRGVIVVGGGLAGMSAAIEAADNGAKVIMLEKEKGY